MDDDSRYTSYAPPPPPEDDDDGYDADDADEDYGSPAPPTYRDIFDDDISDADETLAPAAPSASPVTPRSTPYAWTPPSGEPAAPRSEAVPLPTPTPDASTRGRARDRQRRRSERGEMARVSGSGPRSAARQLRPTGSFQMPKITLPQNTRVIAYVVMGAVLIPVMLLVFQLLKNDPLISEPNAIWIGTEWTYEAHTDDEVKELVTRLRENRIGTVYAWVSWLQEDESWRGTENFEAVRVFAAQFKRLYPEATLYGWVGVPVNVGAETDRLTDSAIRQTIADFSSNVVRSFGFDGVFLNVELVWDGDENFLELLRGVRESLGEDIPLAVAVPPDWSPTNATFPVPPLIAPGTEWKIEYKQSVALLTDHIAIMAYNSGLDNAADYETWMAYQVKAYAEAISALGSGTEIVVGIPTYDAELPAHDPAVENVESALRGIRMGLLQAEESAAVIEGVAIYAAWVTDDTEWTQFKTQWVDAG